MGLLKRIFGSGESAKATRVSHFERRSASTSWDLMTGRGFDPEIGAPVSAHLAENLSAVFACVQIISETIATLPLVVYRRVGDGKDLAPDHPVARLFGREPNTLQTPVEFLEMMTAHVLLRGNAYAEIVRDNRGAPVELIPLHPDHVGVVRFAGSRRVAYDYSDPNTGGTRRLLADEVLHLKDRSDDGIVGKSRLARARETFSTAAATERFAASTYKNGAKLSGVLSHPDQIGTDASENIRKSFVENYAGSGKAGSVAVLEEGLKWQTISVAPEDAQMLESRRFGVEQIARMYRVPPPVLGDLSNGSYSNVTELGRWFYQHTIMPWLTKWERTIERALFSDEGRRSHDVEFDADLLVRGDMLQRFQAYRIGREVGLYSANDLRRFESLNPRTDADADVFLSPMNMQSEQTGEKKDATAVTA
ncbi:MAG: phage portal protein [Rhizobiales bacterium]|nr:phage portal protein [Hyphomicrobiales bacterium]